jgi:hypothetical protein
MLVPELASSVVGMNRIKKLQWPLVFGLGALALIRPLANGGLAIPLQRARGVRPPVDRPSA